MKKFRPTGRWQNILLGVTIVLSLLIVACAPAAAPPSGESEAPSGEAEGEPAEQIVLRFPSWQQDEPGVAEWWKGLIAEFESTHPNVTIEFTKVGRTEFADTLITQFAAGNPPEITHLAAFEFPQFAEQGWLEPLDGFLEGTDIEENWTAQNSCVWEGDTQCVMLLYFGMAMVYNEQMLEEAGVDVPTNWEEYKAAMEAVTQDLDGDGTTDQFGAGLHTMGGSTEMSDMFNFILDAGGNWTNDQGGVTINTPGTIEGLRRWKEIVTSGLTPRDMNSGQVRQLLMQGRVATRIDGPWMWGFIQRADDDVRPHLKVAASPFDPPVGGESNVIAIPKDISQAKKDLVWEFIHLLTRPEWQERYVLAVGAPAPRKGSVTDEAREELPFIEYYIEAMEQASEAGVSRTPKGLETDVNEFTKLLHEQSQAMIIQDKSPEEAAEDLQQQTEELQARE